MAFLLLHNYTDFIYTLRLFSILNSMQQLKITENNSVTNLIKSFSV